MNGKVNKLQDVMQWCTVKEVKLWKLVAWRMHLYHIRIEVATKKHALNSK